jgi:hypothetical protein
MIRFLFCVCLLEAIWEVVRSAQLSRGGVQCMPCVDGVVVHRSSADNVGCNKAALDDAGHKHHCWQVYHP